MQEKTVSGFSRLSKAEKMRWVAERYASQPGQALAEWESFWHPEGSLQQILDGFSENTLSNYVLPYGIAPNFLINGRYYAVPMVIEESSVVAAAASAAKFWAHRGGFHARVSSAIKIGQVHFFWEGDAAKLNAVFGALRLQLRREAEPLTANMRKRGGGVREIRLIDGSDKEPHYYQLFVTFETCDSMGANFINSVLESFASTLERFLGEHPAFEGDERRVDVLMSILSNYTPDCLVSTWVECPVEALRGACREAPAEVFARRFERAVRIAQFDVHRATTHNKGIFNGVDAVALATANDFRAIEACGHAYAARDGHYRSLSFCQIENGTFRFWMDLPLALGTVGGLTNLHPLARRSLDILGNPSAEELMVIIAATGLAQNFSALRSLITTGIQQGHMKMHLQNILNHLKANEEEVRQAEEYFKNQIVSFRGVRDFLDGQRRESGRTTP